MVWRDPSYWTDQRKIRFALLARQRPRQGHPGQAVVMHLVHAEQVIRHVIEGRNDDDGSWLNVYVSPLSTRKPTAKRIASHRFTCASKTMKKRTNQSYMVVPPFADRWHQHREQCPDRQRKTPGENAEGE